LKLLKEAYYIYKKPFTNDHRCVFHFFELNSCDFFVKKIWKQWTIWTKISKGMGFFK